MVLVSSSIQPLTVEMHAGPDVESSDLTNVNENRNGWTIYSEIFHFKIS